ncbi:MAG TPA: hypothetical protein VE986_04955 [Hyphomicrobiales bacterium]|nr:hypothetical protein [Hyphomicrobiales bacterium]
MSAQELRKLIIIRHAKFFFNGGSVEEGERFWRRVKLYAKMTGQNLNVTLRGLRDEAEIFLA